MVIGIPTMTFGEYDYGPTTGRLIVEIANRTLPGYVKGNRIVIYAGDAGRGPRARVRAGQARRARPTDRREHLHFGARDQDRANRGRSGAAGPVPRVDAAAIAVMSAGQFLTGAKARSELGFTATATLDNAIQRALAWFRSNGNVKPN